jgi:hypothetical protein
MSNEIQVGDKYIRGDRYVEILAVSGGKVTYIVRGGIGETEPIKVPMKRFLELEAKTLKNGAEFVPANGAVAASKPCPHGRGTWESKPSDQKRFVTVVVPAHNHDLESLAKSFGAIDIREGNCIAALDRIEDNLKQAVEKACREGV